MTLFRLTTPHLSPLFSILKGDPELTSLVFWFSIAYFLVKPVLPSS